jgi:hypothetical protein
MEGLLYVIAFYIFLPTASGKFVRHPNYGDLVGNLFKCNR